MREPQTMRQVLLALALTSVTPAGRMDADSGGGSVRYYSDTLLADPFGKGPAPDEFPHLYYHRLYDQADSDAERDQIYRAAKDALDWIRRSRGDRSREETWGQLRARVGSYTGWEALEVARETRTGITIVRKARRELGVDLDYGLPPKRNEKLDPRRRREEVRARAAAGMSVRQIAFLLGVSVGTVHGDLDQR